MSGEVPPVGAQDESARLRRAIAEGLDAAAEASAARQFANLRPAVPVVQGADGLREAIARALDNTATGLFMGQSGPGWGDTVARILLGVPEVARLLAERDQAQAKVAAVRELADEWQDRPTSFHHMQQIRRALDGAS